MKKETLVLAVVLALPCFARPRPRQAEPLPPIESHGQRIKRYGCDIMLLSGAPRTPVRWALTVWAEYGDHYRRYWETFLGKYNNAPGVRVIESVGEPLWKGGPVGPVVTSFGIPGANEACVEWSDRVRSEIMPKRNGR
jgi:hypothetical protein